MSRKISENRKAAYYIGMVLGGIGLLLFLSTFITAAAHFGDFSNFEARGRSMATRAISGMVLMIAGGIITSIGRGGLAGSGLKLDPEEAREDLEPFSRQAGGMLKDALDEADIHLGGSPERVIMIRCTACGKLNEEDSKFCQECGKKI